MKCQEVIREFSSYLDGDLDRQAIADLELHLSRCEDCRVVVDTVRKTVEIYCKAEPVPIPEDIRTRLHDALIKRCSRKPAS